MFVQIRENMYLGDENAFKNVKELSKLGITALVVVAEEVVVPDGTDSGVKTFKIGLVSGPNFGYVKDLACHIPKYLSQSGEVVLIQSKNGLTRGAYTIARTICELEDKSIYEIFSEIKDKVPELELSKVYI